jgi:heparanase
MRSVVDHNGSTSMKTSFNRTIRTIVFAACAITSVCAKGQSNETDPSKMQRIGTVDERFQSYNVEMLEVTGGKFWKPYSSLAKQTAKSSATPGSSTPVGMDPNLYEYRAPLNLANARLRKMAEALGPAYIRVSGTWANTTYFQDKPGPAPKTPPAGFDGVLTQEQWKGVVDFAKAADAKIVTSFAASPGVRDSSGVWTPIEADKFLAYTRSVGGEIAATEYMNEPTLASMGGAPKGYDVAAYARDVRAFAPYLKKATPQTIFLGPGGVGEDGALPLPTKETLPSKDILAATGPVFDAFSYHYYGAASARCGKAMPTAMTTQAAALSKEWLTGTDQIESFYAGLRDQYLPRKPLWVTETADAACGGNKWASTFTDSFRYLNQLGSLAQRGVQVVMHNTLDSSDYGLLNESDYKPRPNFWAAVLWRRLMGTTVLQPGPSPSPDLYLYAHCLRGMSGGVALLAINASSRPQTIDISKASRRYVLSAQQLESQNVRLNGHVLKLQPDDTLPAMDGSNEPSGRVTLDPQTITFLAVPGAENEACSQ